MARRRINVRVKRTVRIKRTVTVSARTRSVQGVQRPAPPRLTGHKTTHTSTSLGPLRQAVAAYTGAEEADKEHDVFISHAGEDRDAVVQPLAELLRERGLDVWYSGFELRIGDSLRRRIDSGLGRSRFGVVILSPSFFGKAWPNYELDGLVTREIDGGRQIILPIWHDVTRAEVVKYSASLADKLARNTRETSLAQIADEIAEVVQG